MTLNAENIERLRVGIHQTPDANFDYRFYGPIEGCGCVMNVMSRIGISTWSIWRELGFTTDEENFLVGSAVRGYDGTDYENMTAAEAVGANGKREALRRLRVILERRYGSWRPTS